jgi:8-oxo-dGTP pyrophosphatase MutT (NUDIX family)
MEKFSRIKPKDDFDESKDKVVYSDEHLKIIQFEDWSIIKEKDLVVCIPYLIESNQFVLRHEYIPTYKYVDGQEYHLTLVGGAIETGELIETAMLRELEEEAGIIIKEDYKLEPLKPLYMTKGLTTKVHPFIIPINEREYTEVVPKGDGTKHEGMSKSVKIDAKFIDSLNTSDLITDYMLIKLKEYLNLQK